MTIKSLSDRCVDYVCHGQYDPQSYTHLKSELNDHCSGVMRQEWRRKFALAASNQTAFDAWASSPKGQETLLSVTKEIIGFIHLNKQYALPAHDERQILLKDTVEALRFLEIENPLGYNRYFIIPTFSHDIGRLVEGRLYNHDMPHEEWIPHSQLSYVVLQDILSRHNMPQEIKDDILYSVLAHSGENGQTYMARALQTCDRMQLIGPEGFFRALSYKTGLMKQAIANPNAFQNSHELPDLEGIEDAVTLLEFYGRNMRENIGADHKEWQREMQVQNTMLLLVWAKYNPSVLYPEVHKLPEKVLGTHKKPIAQDIFDEAKIRLVSLSPRIRKTESQTNPDAIVKNIVSALEEKSGSAPMRKEMIERLRTAVLSLSQEESLALQEMIGIARILREELDHKDHDLLAKVAETSEDQVSRLLASEALGLLEAEKEPVLTASMQETPVIVPALVSHPGFLIPQHAI